MLIVYTPDLLVISGILPFSSSLATSPTGAIIATSDIIDLRASNHMTHHFGAVAQMLHYSARDRTHPCLSIHHFTAYCSHERPVRKVLSSNQLSAAENPRVRFEFCLNPLAPLFADFHIRIPSTNLEDPHLLRIEHRLRQSTVESRPLLLRFSMIYIRT